MDRQEWGGLCRVAKRGAGRRWWPKAEKCCGESAQRTDLPRWQPRREREPAEEIGELRSSPTEKVRAKEALSLVYSAETLFLSNLRRYFNRLQPRRISRFKPSGAGEAGNSRLLQPGLPRRHQFQPFRRLECGGAYGQQMRCTELQERSNRLTGIVFSRVLAGGEIPCPVQSWSQTGIQEKNQSININHLFTIGYERLPGR